MLQSLSERFVIRIEFGGSSARLEGFVWKIRRQKGAMNFLEILFSNVEYEGSYA
jgi:hypothetical protein